MYFLILFFAFINFQSDNISIENSWIRNSSMGLNTAVFFDVTNKGDAADTLLKAESDLAELVQIHETYKNGDVMGMREVSKVIIEPNSTFKFKPMAHHIMLISLKKDLDEGETGEITLHFAQAGIIKISAPVKTMKMQSHH